MKRTEKSAANGIPGCQEHAPGRRWDPGTRRRSRKRYRRRFHPFYLAVNGARAKSVNEAIEIYDNVNDISAILQEESPEEEGGSRVQ